MKKELAAVAMMVVLGAGSAQAALIAQWDTSGKTGSEISISGAGSANVTTTNLVRGSGLSASAAGNNFGSAGWSGTDAGDYYQFGFTVDNGYQTAINELWIATRSSATGPGTMGVYTSLDNYTKPVYTITQTSATYVNSKISLENLGSVTGAFSIRLIEIGNTQAGGSGATAGTGTFRAGDYYDGTNYQNIILSGNTSAVPTPIPAAAWLLGSGLLGLVGIRRRQG